MSHSGIVTLPIIRGPVIAPGPWQALLGQANKRVYPFTAGAMADESTSGTTIKMGGLGTFVANDYIIVCSATAYGNSTLFIPDVNKIRRISSVSGSEDDIVVGSAVVVVAGDYILNIGSDNATSPLVDPNFNDIVTLYDDPYGADTNALGYLVTGAGGHFRGWVPAGNSVVDFLITNEDGVPEVVLPFYSVGRQEPNSGWTAFSGASTVKTLTVGTSSLIVTQNVLGTLIETLKARGLLSV